MKLIDIQALSALLSVKPKTIYDWVNRRCIPCYKLNGLLRFDEDEISQWLRSKKQSRFEYIVEPWKSRGNK
jgi:excisionase family DNA binding protein